MSNHLRHCSKHRKPLPCAHCAAWLLAKVPPPVITLDVVSLLATKDFLPISWAKRKRRIENLHRRDQRREANFLRRIDRIADSLEMHKCPKCGGQSLRIWLDEHSEMHACRYAACRYLQVWSLKPPLEGTVSRPVIFHPDTGEQLVPVPLPSRLVSKAFLLHLVHEYGYDFEAAASSFTLCFTYHRPEKRKPQPLAEATQENLMKALSRRRYKDPNMRLAVRSVIGGAAVDKVASRYRLNKEVLERNVRQIEESLEAMEA